METQEDFSWEDKMMAFLFPLTHIYIYITYDMDISPSNTVCAGPVIRTGPLFVDH